MNEGILQQIMNSGVCWIILVVATVCYQQLFAMWLKPSSSLNNDITPTLIKVLPLLGLLGTIMGLLASFSALQAGFTGAELFSQGISDALLTTQLGLICAVPAWTIHNLILSRSRRCGLANG